MQEFMVSKKAKATSALSSMRDGAHNVAWITSRESVEP